MVPRWISSRPNLSARAKKMQRAYAGRRIGPRTDSYWEGCKKSASQMLRRGNDANSKPECVRPSAVTLAVRPTYAVCRGGRSTSARRAAPSVLLRFAIEITVVAGRYHFGRRSPVGAVLQLAQQRRSRSEGAWRRFRFCHDARLVRGRRRHVRSDPAVRSGQCRVRRFRGCSQPCASHIRDLAVVCKMDLFDTNGTLRVPLKHMFLLPLLFAARIIVSNH